MIGWIIVALVLGGLLVLTYLRACRAELVARQCRVDVVAALQLAVTTARVVLDHETVEKLAAGVTWAPRDDLDKDLLELRAQAEELLRGY